MKIVVLDAKATNPGDNPWTPVEAFGEVTTYDQTKAVDTLARAAGADVLITNKVVLDAETLAQLPDLKFVTVLATGYNVVDVEAARKQGVVVSNAPGYSTGAVAQFTFALLLELCHHVGHHSQQVAGGEWARRGEFCFWDTPLVELAGKTMGIVGWGSIGQEVGRLANAFGMEVLACATSPHPSPDFGPWRQCELDELVAESDVVSLHCPLTPDNERFFGADRLARMKPSAFLINTARGALIDSAALRDALNRDQLAAAAIDVTTTEPVSPDDPLLEAKNCLITPHIAWATLAARKRLMNITAQNIGAFIEGNPIHVVS